MTDLRNRSTAVVASIGALAALGIAISIATTPLPSATAASPATFGQTEWTKSVAQLGQARESDDVIPEKYSLSTIARDSAIRIADHEAATYWAALQADGQLCLIVTFKGPNDIAAYTCATSAAFGAHGLGLQAATVDGSTRAYLVPDGIEDAVPGLEAINTNLLIGDPYQGEAKPLTLQISGSSRIDLMPFGIPDDYTDQK